MIATFTIGFLVSMIAVFSILPTLRQVARFDDDNR